MCTCMFLWTLIYKNLFHKNIEAGIYPRLRFCSEHFLRVDEKKNHIMF